MIFGVILRFLGPGGIAAVAIAALLGLQTVRLTFAHAGEKRAQAAEAMARADLKTCHDNTAALNASLDRQNAAVGQVKAEGDARVAVSLKAASAARAVAESYRRSEAAVLAAKRTTSDVCADADRLILDHVK